MRSQTNQIRLNDEGKINIKMEKEKYKKNKLVKYLARDYLLRIQKLIFITGTIRHFHICRSLKYIKRISIKYREIFNSKKKASCHISHDSLKCKDVNFSKKHDI